MNPWNDPLRWNRLQAGEGCALCAPCEPAEVVWSTPAGWLRVPRRACLAGYACFVAARHVVEWHDLPAAAAADFLHDLNRAAACVKRLTAAAKLNLASYGNLVPHLHVHICPRVPGDRFESAPLDFGAVDEVYAPGDWETHVARLRAALSGADHEPSAGGR